MSENKGFQSIWIPLIVFVALGAAVVGVETVPTPQTYQIINEDCQKYFSDEDNDGANGFIEDGDCMNYPYDDGLGETATPTGLAGSSSNPYQPYYDLTVDFVRAFIIIECNGNLANCVGTNFQWESQFYCWFSFNIMNKEFDVIFDKFFNYFQTLPDDGSITMYQNLCQQFGPPSGLLPTIEYQQSTSIPENVGSGAK